MNKSSPPKITRTYTEMEEGSVTLLVSPSATLAEKEESPQTMAPEPVGPRPDKRVHKDET